MNQKELKELIEFLIEKDIAEFELERGDVKVRIKRAGESVHVPDSRFYAVQSAPSPVELVAASPVAPAAPPEATKAAEPAEELHAVRSPIVGTFYEAPSPGAPPFVKPGDTVAVGQVLCIVEAMKLMNEIESELEGSVLQILVENGHPVEYGEPLFKIKVG